MRETWVQSLGWEDPLEKEMATHSSILAWRIPWTEEPGGLQFIGSQRVRHDWATSLHFTSTSSQPDVEDIIAAHSWIPALYLSLMFGVSRTFRKNTESCIYINICSESNGSFPICSQNTICKPEIDTHIDTVMGKSVHMTRHLLIWKLISSPFLHNFYHHTQHLLNTHYVVSANLFTCTISLKLSLSLG